MVGIKCCIPHCENLTTVRHRFPNPKKYFEIFNKWKAIIPENIYKGFSDDQIYNRLRVCGSHFEENCYSIGTQRLNRDAFPTLYIPEIIIENDEVIGDVAEINCTPSEDRSVHILSENIELSETSEIEKIRIGIENVIGKNKFKMLERELKELIKLRDSGKESGKEKIKKLRKLVHTKHFTSITKNLSPQVFNFITSQLKSANVKCKGRRFNIGDKIQALSIMKHSPNSYRLLRKIFSLPMRTTLNKMIENVDIKPGFDNKLYDYLKHVSENLQPIHKFCNLVFYDVNQTAHLDCNAVEDNIIGFEDYGNTEVTSKLTDHAIVFMLRGVVQKWKKPVLYYLVSSTCSANQIAETLKKLINTAQQCGLKIVSTVCDAGITNISAIKNLKDTSKIKAAISGGVFRSSGFEVNGQIINHIIDPPHLIKLIRNHLLQKNLHYKTDNINKVAKWEHILKLYETDSKVGSVAGINLLSKLTDQHVIESEIKKKKVSHCVQVLSETVARIMSYVINLYKLCNATSPCLNNDAMDTSFCILFLDRLFDSMNGYLPAPQRGKELRGPFGTIQQKFWDEEAKPLLRSMHFKKGEKTFNPACVNFLLKNMDNFNEIEKTLRLYGVKYIYLRNFNQDPLENFIGSVRSLNYTNVNPNSAQFILLTETYPAP